MLVFFLPHTKLHIWWHKTDTKMPFWMVSNKILIQILITEQLIAKRKFNNNIHKKLLICQESQCHGSWKDKIFSKPQISNKITAQKILLGKVLKVDFIYTVLQTIVEFLKIPPKFDSLGAIVGTRGLKQIQIHGALLAHWANTKKPIYSRISYVSVFELAPENCWNEESIQEMRLVSKMCCLWK